MVARWPSSNLLRLLCIVPILVCKLLKQALHPTFFDTSFDILPGLGNFRGSYLSLHHYPLILLKHAWNGTGFGDNERVATGVECGGNSTGRLALPMQGNISPKVAKLATSDLWATSDLKVLIIPYKSLSGYSNGIHQLPLSQDWIQLLVRTSKKASPIDGEGGTEQTAGLFSSCASQCETE